MWIIYLFLFIVFAVLFIIFISFVIHLILISKREHRKIEKSDTPSTYIKRGVLKRLFKDFPEALARDLLNRDPDEFPFDGFHCYCGEQGSGKTISMVARLRELKQKYPKVKILSNLDCEFSDGVVNDWKDIVFTENGKHGIIIALDEIQNWFSTNESKDFPPEMLQEVSQQRKQHKMIMGTSQRFHRMAKPLREQINFLYEPITFAHCLTFVRRRKPAVDDDGKLDRFHTRKLGIYFFVHDEELRNSYDTFQKILRQANGGYTANPLTKEQPLPAINVAIDARKRKLLLACAHYEHYRFLAIMHNRYPSIGKVGLCIMSMIIKSERRSFIMSPFLIVLNVISAVILVIYIVHEVRRKKRIKEAQAAKAENLKKGV